MINDDFRSLGLSELMLEAIATKGFETPSPIQRLTIPALLDGTNDLIAQAQTGTGKTAAFGLPVLDKMSPSKTGIQALILVPTRELALQVTEELLSFNQRKKLHIAPIYGGASISEQLRRLAKGVDIVVGTPGRILDHIRRGTLKLETVRHLILDEADEMLNMGFIEDVEEIMSHTNENRRVLLFSATMPDRIVAMSRKYMRNPAMLKVESQNLTVDLTNQIYFEVRESEKFDALTRIIDVESDFYGIVFSRTKVGVDEMVNRLLERGYAAEGLHGDVSQAQREKILRKFKRKQANILVATDVAARGIDVNNLSHVINYSLPQDSESYVHRIGRTGRAGNEGTAITFISSSELRQFGYLRREIKADIRKETLPTPQDIVATKKAKIIDDLNEIIETGNYTDYDSMAVDILGQHSPEVALSALLRLAFKSDLSENQYPEIRSINVDRRGKTRLFISIGRMDGYDARKLTEMLKRECGLNDSQIDDVRVMDSYSFVTVPFGEADTVVRKLNRMGKGDRPLAGLAKEPKAVSDDGGASDFEKRPPRRERPKREAQEEAKYPPREDRPERRPAPAEKREPAKRREHTIAEEGREDIAPVKPRTKAVAKPQPAGVSRSGERDRTLEHIPVTKSAKARPANTFMTPEGEFDWAAFEKEYDERGTEAGHGRNGGTESKKRSDKPAVAKAARSSKNTPGRNKRR